MAVSLCHGRTFVREELLQGVKINLATADKHAGVCVPQAVQGPKIFWQTCLVTNSAGYAPEVLPLPPVLAWKYELTGVVKCGKDVPRGGCTD